jgi:hypothetical protein
MSYVADTSRATNASVRLVAEWRSDLAPPLVRERVIAATPTSRPEVWLGDGADLVRATSNVVRKESTSSLQRDAILVVFDGFIVEIRSIVGGALVRLLQQGDAPVDLSIVRHLLSSTASEEA